MSRFLIVLIVSGLAIAGGLAWYRTWSTTATVEPAEVVPPLRSDHEFVGSTACQQCHRGQHESWHRTYHRTMTQLATPQTVVAAFNGVRLDAGGQITELFEQDGSYWAEVDDPEWERTSFLAGNDIREVSHRPRKKVQLVMTTGSHNFQAYWFRSEYGRELWQLPWRYDLRSRQWVHRRDVFLGPPEWRPGMHFKVWNDNCIFCHATGGRPGLDPSSNYLEHTTVAEFGIACESCHGPGRRHIEKHTLANNGLSGEKIADGAEKPADGIKRSTDGSADPTIVHPAKLDHERSSEICGACHSNFLHDTTDVMAMGSQFRPGERLTQFGRFFRPDTEADDDIVSRFWADGVSRSTGREFMGLKQSTCYRQGTISCLSCHSMHDSDPDDQLAAGMHSNQACLQCHSEMANDITAHTHHSADSAGSQCYNCHMPHTNYGLFKATRNHQITSPQVTTIVHKSRPNACNLCHLDRTLQWSAQHLTAWYGQESVLLADDERQVAAWPLWLLRGDAGQRVVAAWHAGWPEAQRTAGDRWLAPIVAPLLKDPYAAVRIVAARSMQVLPDIEEFEFSTEAPRDAEADFADAMRRWDEAAAPNDIEQAGQAVGVSGNELAERLKQIIDRRDDRPIASVE